MKKRLPVLGALILTPLLLSACTSGATSTDQPSPTPTFLNAGSLFDAPSQVELPKGSGEGVFLSKGMAFFERVEKEVKPVDTSTPAPRDTPTAAPRPGMEFNFKYKQYDGQGDGWSTPLTKSESPDVKRSAFMTSWQGKKYVVAVQSFAKNTDKPDSIAKGVLSQVTIADVLDPETGKLIKTIRNELANGSSSIPSTTTEGVIVVTQTEGEVRIVLFDPSTGSVADEFKYDNPDQTVIGSANGKLVTSIDNYDAASVSIPNGANIKGFGTVNGMVVASKLTPKGEASNTTLVLDGTSGKQIASLDCMAISARGAYTSIEVERGKDSQITTSPDGRYIIVGQMEVIDTKTGKGFCGAETEKQKAVKIANVDNAGNAYGSTSAGYFKINVESGEVTAVDTDLDRVERPAFISADGWGVFPQLGSAEKSFAIPPKK